MKLFRDLDAVAQDAGGALDRDKRTSLFERLDWFRLLEAHCPAEGELLVLRARSGDARAWLFLKVTGRKATGLANWYSFDFGTIADGTDAACVKLLIAGLRKARIAALDLSPLPAGDPLGPALSGAGWLTRSSPATMRWTAETDGMDFATYWAARPSRLRHTAARKAKAAALDIRIHTSFDATAWADYERVYRASWKPSEGSPAFLRALAEQEGAAGALRLGVAYHERAPVAAQFWITENGVAAIHKLAHDESAKSLSPGTLLGEAMFRHALDIDRVRRIDFGLGDDRYKAEWVDRCAPMQRLVAFDLMRASGIGAAARTAAGALVRRVRND